MRLQDACKSLMSAQAIFSVARKELGSSYDKYVFAKKVVEITLQADLSKEERIKVICFLEKKIYNKNSIFPNDHTYEGEKVLASLPSSWEPFLCEYVLSLGYRNPNDPQEYIIFAPPKPSSNSTEPYVIHHTGGKRPDQNWYQNELPKLEFLENLDKPGEHLRKAFAGQALNLGEINTVHHFLKKSPILKIEDICTSCYKLGFPKRGFGVWYKLRDENRPKKRDIPPNGFIDEVRYCPEKMRHSIGIEKLGGQYQYQEPFVSMRVIVPEGIWIFTGALNANGSFIFRKSEQDENLHVMQNPKTGNQVLSETKKRRYTHIPAKLFNFGKYHLVCTCIK